MDSAQQNTKRDYRSQPFRVAVAIGDAVTAGGDATSPELCWASRLADAIKECQSQPITMHNNGIGANVISHRSPTHDPSRGPSAMERFRDHVIAFKPDLVLFSYGLNDARGGTPITQFLEDERQIVVDIRNQTGAVVVVVNTYFMTAFDFMAPYNKANLRTLMCFNAALNRMAEEMDILYADVFDALGLAPWMIDPANGVHPNNLGHRVIADRIFAVLAQNCSCLSQRSFELRKTMKPWREREKELLKAYYAKKAGQELMAR